MPGMANIKPAVSGMREAGKGPLSGTSTDCVQIQAAANDCTTDVRGRVTTGLSVNASPVTGGKRYRPRAHLPHSRHCLRELAPCLCLLTQFRSGSELMRNGGLRQAA